MKTGPKKTLAWLAFAAAVAGCNSGSGGGSGLGDLAMAAAQRSALLADTNRDGVIDEKDRAGKSDWTAAGGAVFLANLDDDDSKAAADASDEIVNGPNDAKDLARVKLTSWATAPMAASATLTIETNVDGPVRLFRTDGTNWTVVASPVSLSNADLVAGVEFGIEAKDFAQKIDPKVWDGYATLHLLVTGGGAGAGDASAGTVDDRVKLRVAPFVMVNNLSNIGQIWNNSANDKGGVQFHADLQTFTTTAKSDLQDASPPDGQDQWAEDWWQIGVTFMPGPGGTTQGMRVAQRSAQPDRLAGGYAEQVLGPDVAYIWPHTDSAMGQKDGKGYSMDSFGNHDTIPPYVKGPDSYPLGRIIVGGSKVSHIDPVVRAFYDAQRVQPVVQVDTSWLYVGHIDEIITYVPAKTPRGWKLLIASPKLARTMLQSLVTAGQGGVKMFVGKQWLDLNSNKMSPAAITVTALLADAEIMAASEAAQALIDADVAVVKTELGLAADEIIEIPMLFERTDIGGGTYNFLSHMVGTVNLRAANGAVGIPTPHGPMISGSDFFEKDLVDRLGSAINNLGSDGMGLKVKFVEDWDDYHVLIGEVHCGSTSAVMAMPNVTWWEAGR